MQALASHPSLLPTLTRLLREDGARSLDLAAAVACALYALSGVRQLHRAIAELQAGALLLELCQLEVARTAQRIEQDGRAAAPTTVAARLASAAATNTPPLSDK